MRIFEAIGLRIYDGKGFDLIAFYRLFWHNQALQVTMGVTVLHNSGVVSSLAGVTAVPSAHCT